MKNSVKIATAGVFTALSVILLALGSIVWIFSYTAPLICGLIMIMLIESYGKKTALLVYSAVSVISLIMLTGKEMSLLYAMLCGYYPVLVQYINKIKSRATRIIIKLVIFNVSVLGVELICIYVLGIPFENMMGTAGIILMIFLANVILFAYDRLIVVLNIIYVKKYKKRLEKYLK